MPATKSKSKFSINKSLAAHGEDETSYGIEKLPPNINDGVARLRAAKIGVFKTGPNKGEKFVRMEGTVFEPAEQKGRVTTFGPEPMCDTVAKTTGNETSGDEHVAKILNEMRKIGGKDCTKEIESEDDLEAALDALVEAEPFFSFSTSQRTNQKGDPDGAWENWHRMLEDYEPSDDDGTVDESDDEEEDEPKAKPKSTKGKPKAKPEPEDEDDEDLDALAEQADEGDQEAIDKLSGRCKIFNIDPEHKKFKTWAMVATALNEASEEDTGEGEDDDDAEEEMTPSKGDVVWFKPAKSKSRIEVEVESVQAKSKTVTVKDLADDTVFAKVKWGELFNSKK